MTPQDGQAVLLGPDREERATVAVRPACHPERDEQGDSQEDRENESNAEVHAWVLTKCQICPITHFYRDRSGVTGFSAFSLGGPDNRLVRAAQPREASARP